MPETTTTDEFEKAPKYFHLAERLRRQIENGELQPGDRLPSFVQMKEQFNANAATVERVYRILEQEDLIVREHRRGVFVAHPLAKIATGVIGVGGVTFAERRRYPYYAHIMEGIQQAAGEAHREILLLNDASPISWEKVDGVLLHSTYGDVQEQALYALPHGMPCVSLLKPLNGIISIIADEAGGVRDVVRHLVQLGHRRIAFLISPFLTHRRKAYEDAMQDADIEFSSAWIRHAQGEPGRSYMEVAREAMQQWLHEDWAQLKCSAVLTQNDDAALGVMQALQEAGIAVPEEVSVVGFDGTEVSEYANPSLTTVEMPLRKIGTLGIEVLLKQIQEEPVTMATTVLPIRLRVRASTAEFTGERAPPQ